MRCEQVNISGSFYRNKCKFLNYRKKNVTSISAMEGLSDSLAPVDFSAVSVDCIVDLPDGQLAPPLL